MKRERQLIEHQAQDLALELSGGWIKTPGPPTRVSNTSKPDLSSSSIALLTFEAFLFEMKLKVQPPPPGLVISSILIDQHALSIHRNAHLRLSASS